MTDFTREWIAKREQLEQAATDGPWCAEYSGEQGDCVIPHDAESTREAVATTRLYHSGADAEFIADARTALPAALAALKAVLEMHRLNRQDDGPCQGYADSSYGYLDRWCVECSEKSGLEYGAPWPCPTVAAVEAALRGES